MDANRKHWNEQQKLLNKALTHAKDHPEWLDLFLAQHAAVHAGSVAETGQWSLVDEVLAGLDDSGLRRIPKGGEHSIVWMLWHMARCEDVTMNVLLVGAEQVLLRGGWLERLGIPNRDTGNALDERAMQLFSESIDLSALHAYRAAVGHATRDNVCQLTPAALKIKTDPARLQRAMDEGAVEVAAHWLIDYWSGLTIAGLLLMPPTRHNFVHLNEALRVKAKKA